MASPPILSLDALRALAHDVLAMTTADRMTVFVTHRAINTLRVSRNRVQLTNSGETLSVVLSLQFGGYGSAGMALNQADPASLHEAVRRLERIAREMPGDSALPPEMMPVAPRRYLPNTVSRPATMAALTDDLHTVVPRIVRPLKDAQLDCTAFVGIVAQSTLYADTQGMLAVGEETDTELSASGWNRASGGTAGSGWAGQVAREWRALDPDAVAASAVRLTRLAANPVAFEPGRRMTILGRPAVAQIVRAMGNGYDAQTKLMGLSPLSPFQIHDRVVDERVTLSSDPNDPDGGYLPFNRRGFPLVAMTWLDRGRLANLAYSTNFAARMGVVPANDAPTSLRLSGPPNGAPVSIDEMIANCREGIYVNRLSNIEVLHVRSGVMTGVTNGGCYLVRNGKIEKAIKDLRFLDSPYFFLNRLEAIGATERTAFGYAPWHGDWPIAPTIVPPIMVRDFNFTALADAV